MGRKEEANLAKAALAVANSDHLTMYKAYLGYVVMQIFCKRQRYLVVHLDEVEEITINMIV